MKIGTQIMIARKDKKLTQTDLSHCIGISVNSISLIERGITNPKHETLEKIAEQLGVCFSVG